LAKSNQTFQKRQRENKLREKAQQKRERRQQRHIEKKQAHGLEAPGSSDRPSPTEVKADGSKPKTADEPEDRKDIA
jgi:hypothetical protein